MVLKTEAALILKHPEYQMNEQLKLHLVKNNQIQLGESNHILEDIFEEDRRYDASTKDKIIQKLKEFMKQRLLTACFVFFIRRSMYLCSNNTLLFHGCVPLNEQGYLKEIKINGTIYKGKSFFDYCDQQARNAYFHEDSEAIDFMFYLWGSIDSPLSGRQLKTFERFFIKDQSMWLEKRNPYYEFYNREECCLSILEEFHMNIKLSHIINETALLLNVMKHL